MGDFYELFFEDAVDRLAGARHHADQARQASRPGHSDVRRAGACGRRLPAEADRAQGFRVAVCEQLEDPAEAKKRGSKSVVRRDVTRLVTPGTITEEKLLDPVAASFLMAVGRSNRAPAANGACLDRHLHRPVPHRRKPRRNGCCRTSLRIGRAS
jgi:DNA mismatch repair protein MutS